MSETKEKTGWFARLKQGLRKTQVNLVGIFTGGVVDEAFLEDLEFQMISADIGVETSALILERLRKNQTQRAEDAGRSKSRAERNHCRHSAAL